MIELDDDDLVILSSFPQQYTFVYIQHMPRLWVLLSHSVHSSGARLDFPNFWVNTYSLYSSMLMITYDDK